MILGILSDVHSNWWTLRDILEQHLSIDQWICLGDFTGLLPTVNEAIDLLRKHQVVCIRGDHETCLVKNTQLKQSFSGNEVLALQRKVVSQKTKDWILELPATRELRFGKITVLITHNLTGPSANKKYSIDLTRLEQKYNTKDIVLFGHTHLPFYWEGKRTLFLNPGSLGFPVSKTKYGTFATIDTDTLQSRFHWVNPHTADCLDSLRKHSYPKRIIDIMKQGAV
jgi:putative phosphoesterase